MAAEKNVDRIVHDRWFHGVTSAVMLEVGAARPDYLSVGEFYRELGWRVLSIEPNPEFCQMHREQGNEILQYACSDEDRDDVDFYLVNSNAAEYLDGQVTYESFSSLGLDENFQRDLKKSEAKPVVSTTKVNVRKLDTILREHAPELNHVDLLAVDVEGWELAVMRGFNLARYRPKVVILENFFKTREYRSYMRKNGYMRWLRLKPNEIYVAKEAIPSRLDRMLLRAGRAI